MDGFLNVLDNQIAYIGLILLALAISVFFFYKASGTFNPTRANMVWMVFVNILFFSFFGAIIIAFDIDNHYLANRIGDKATNAKGLLLMLFLMIFLPLSIWLTQKLFRFDARKENIRFSKSPLKPVYSDKDSYMYIPLVILAVICILSVIYTYAVIGISNSPLFNFIKGASATRVAELRINAKSNFQGLVYIRNLIALGLTPILSYIFYAYSLMYKSFKWVSVFSLLFVSSVFILLYDMEKAPVIYYMLGYIFLTIYAKGRIGKYKLAGMAALVVVAVVGMYIMLDVPMADLFKIDKGPVGRVLLTQCVGLFLYLDIFPKAVPFLKFSPFSPSISNGIFNTEHVRPGSIAMRHYHPEQVEMGTAGVMNTIFLGEAYSMFGYGGAIVSVMIVGFVVGALSILFVRLEKNPITVGLYAYFTIQLPNMIQGGFADFIYSPNMMFIAATVITIIVFGFVLKKTNKPGKATE